MNALSPQDSLELARFALDHIDEAALITDQDGRFLYVNQCASRILAYPPAELLEKTLFQIGPDLTPELWKQLWKEIRAREVFAFDFALQSKTNRSFQVEFSVRRVKLAGQEIMCAFFRDVDEHKRLQQLKNEFVSTVSHELRTPMTIIRESVSQLLDGLMGEVPQTQREALYVTLAGIDRLARIINDLLDVSKMEAGKASLKWDRVNLTELIREVLETFAARAKDRGLELYATLPAGAVILYADYDRLTRVFTNLVGNALKFSEKGKIQITVHERENEVECEVSDTGLGIAKEDLNRVFNKFEQLSHAAVTGEKGSGLGLSICKGIVELHQGRIWVDSQPGEGSAFRFTLPKRTARELFQQKMSTELALAEARKGHVTGIRFHVKTLKTADPRKDKTQLGWALDELIETIKAHGARKTDILVADADGVWLGLLNMNKKEAGRVAQNILDGFKAALERNDLAGSANVTLSQCSFSEEVTSEQDLMKRLSGEVRDAA